jgi:probable phosphoglycerate mutase
VGSIEPHVGREVGVTSIYLVRHGQTVLNAQGRFRGRQDPPLDETGSAQARAAARALADVGLSEVFSSPLLRTRHTAEAIAARCGVPIAVEHRLIDLDYGDWENLTEAEAETVAPEAWRTFKADPRSCVAPNGEAFVDLERRVFDALTDIGEHHPDESVGAVSHDLPILVALARVADLTGERAWEMRVPTGSITSLSFADGELALAGGPGAGP